MVRQPGKQLGHLWSCLAGWAPGCPGTRILYL